MAGCRPLDGRSVTGASRSIPGPLSSQSSLLASHYNGQTRTARDENALPSKAPTTDGVTGTCSDKLCPASQTTELLISVHCAESKKEPLHSLSKIMQLASRSAIFS